MFVRSIFVKILLWFFVTLIVCLAGIGYTNDLRNRFDPGRHDFFSRSVSLQVSDAREAYETGGKPALQAYFARLEILMPGHHALVDEHGIDLLTGVDRSAEVSNAGPHWSPASDSRMILAWPTRDGKYKMIINAPAPVGPWSAIPYFLWVAVAAVVFCYILAVQLAAPLRTLEQTVERFGRGDLEVRAKAKRQDEIGKLARAFNVMANRIQTLLTAERRLLQDVSHELRSPLARLEFAVELAKTSPDRSRAMARIQKEVDRLSTLISELLQVTRAENDPESRNLVPLDLRDLLQDVVDDCAMEGEARDVQLHVMTKVESVQMQGDHELLRRAIENVLRNAIRYAPERTSVDITLTTAADKSIIEVRDFGPGVPEDSLPHLFRPFFRAEADRNRNSGGVGLGLSIAQRALAVHQGSISARNASPGLVIAIEIPTPQAPQSATAPLLPERMRG
jgi:two-component system sensor histidine kinase CpxA